MLQGRGTMDAHSEQQRIRLMGCEDRLTPGKLRCQRLTVAAVKAAATSQ
jgi:hypothetical protein